MQKTNDLLSSYVYDLANPDQLVQLVKGYWAKKGIKINQDKTVAPFTAYVNAVAVSQTSIQFNFPDGTFGTTSGGVSGSTYPDSEHMLIVGIRVLQGASATLALSPWVQGVADPNILNGRMTLNNNGTIALKDVPLSRFPVSTGNADLDGGYYQLDQPIAWVGQTSLFVNVAIPTATAVANTNLRMELVGIKLI